MANLTTDAAILAKEASNFERIADELKTEIARVEQTANELLNSHWQGTAASAAEGAIARFKEAANSQVRELNDISTNIQTAGAQYSTTDSERSGAIASAMGSAMGGPNGSNGHGSAPAQQNGQVHPATAGTAGSGVRGGVSPGVFRHSNDAPNPIQLVDFKQGPGPGPTPTPVPTPPVTGDPIRLPPRTTMNTSPPTAMNPSNHEPGKHQCSPGEIAKDTTIAVGGAGAIAGGIGGEIPSLGGSTIAVIGGIGTLWDGVDKLSECE
jgi:WXG100 family type VII secretion target